MIVYLIRSSVQIPRNNYLSLQQFETYFLFQSQAAIFSFMNVPKTFFVQISSIVTSTYLTPFDNGIFMAIENYRIII